MNIADFSTDVPSAPIPSYLTRGAHEAKGMGNPTVLLFTLALGVGAAGVTGYLRWHWPDAAVLLIDALGLYLGFTVLHDAVHGVAHVNRLASRLMATAIGFLLTFTYPFFLRIHLRHHAHTNCAGADPDAILAALPAWAAPWLGGVLLYGSYHYSFFRQKLWRSRMECVEVVLCDAAYLGILAGAIHGGWLHGLLVVWVLPLILTLHWLVYTFDYLPHAPHDSSARLYCARAYGGRWLAVLHLNQNYHLIHHLWPKVPWFRYRQVYLAQAPALAKLGCRVGWKERPPS